MIDLKLTEINGVYDISYAEKGDFEMTDGFDTAILMSIFCEERAGKDEVPESIRRRGWIGNLFYNNDGYQNGSKFWIHSEQGRANNVTLNAIINSVSLGLQWFVDDKIAKNKSASISLVGGIAKLKISIEYSASKVDERFFDIWENTGK